MWILRVRTLRDFARCENNPPPTNLVWADADRAYPAQSSLRMTYIPLEVGCGHLEYNRKEAQVQKDTNDDPKKMPGGTNRAKPVATKTANWPLKLDL